MSAPLLPMFAFFSDGQMRTGTVLAQPGDACLLRFDPGAYAFNTAGLRQQLLFFSGRAELEIFVADLLSRSLLRAA
jgi:hypothetical protein